MVKHRKSASIQHKHGNSNDTSSSSGGSETSNVKRFSWRYIMKMVVGGTCLVIAVYIGTLGYLETRVNTPYVGEKAVQETGLDVPERYWGSYRPGVYFGMRAREPKSPLFGMMWYELSLEVHKGIRHWCDQNDRLASYGWLRHDGENFGEQLIADPPHMIYTSFIKTPGGKLGGHWTARINITAVEQLPIAREAFHFQNERRNLPFVFIWYAAFDGTQPSSEHILRYQGEAIKGYSPELGNFKINLIPYKGKLLHTSYTEAHSAGPHMFKDTFYSLLSLEEYPGFGKLAVVGPDPGVKAGAEVNFIPVQMLVETPFVIDIVYSTEDMPTPPIRGEEYTRALDEHRRRFDRRFEETFMLAEKGYAEDEVSIARAAMSNMVGSIGYFYGMSRVRSQYTTEPVPYWKAALYTGVPSRSFFPRGFLWDEGFHGLLIGRWSLDIVLDIAAHWLDLLNVEGWIPREQILGAEALARVPKEFVVQSNAAANPPMLAVTLARLVRSAALSNRQRETLGRMFSRLQAWYLWFLSTQRGEEHTSYRWRGREDDGVQLNPKTLTSGLDDYPRASHPSDIERHVDLRCWMYATADAMATIADVLGREPDRASHPSDIERHVDLRCWMYATADAMATIADVLGREPDRFEAVRDQLGYEDLLNELHWSPEAKMYADYGLHSDNIRLVRQPPKKPNEQGKVVRHVSTPPKPKLVTSAFGYVSLFPMLLKVLQPESEKLGKILEDLAKPELLWSPYGLRSLSKSSPYYMKRNTEHDPPYWRGQVWININYLALSALKHYGVTPGPYSVRARELHQKLRDNVVGNIISEYKRTGYLWEQYSGDDGKGSGSQPFTGWTALLVLIMADEY